MMAAAPDGRGSQRSMAGLGRFGAAVAIGRWPSGQVRRGATWASRPSAATHRTLIVFTACWGCRPSPVSYSLATVDHRSAGTARRRQLTTAIVAALSLFVALIAGSSLRPQFAAAALPEPAAWTHGTLGGQAHASQVQLHAAAQPVSHLDHAFSPSSTPTNKKPFHSMWMTRDRPTSWTHLSPQSGWLPLPASFAASEFQPRGTHWAAPAAAPVNRDILIRLCVTRC
jgi:hypothetical protein